MLKDIENANAKFYEAFENLSITMMESVWSHSDNCICIHPGWEMFVGWLAIRESWMTIFANTENIKFTITNSKTRIYQEVIAVITCLENIEMFRNEEKIQSAGVVATNIFEYNNNQKKWLIVHHHGSPLSNYIPPPLVQI
ncbi:MAG TPA: nuclear transport factor 2 family protein [Nitrososphaeraceae archaeon]|jgi:aspartyl-tRNA synthetase|nr:nuclear transport factor 2 family protein [Nitrososphaeraceae archaeon]